VLASTLVWHLSNFAFNSVAARALGPASYGALAAVVAVLYVVSPLFVSIQTVSSRLTTRLGNDGAFGRVRWLTRYYAVRLALVGLLLAAAVALGSSALARFLRVPSAAPIAILGVAFVFSAVTHLQRGVLQGTMRFGRYAVSTLIEAAAKIVATVALLVWVWRSVNGAMLAIATASLVALCANVGLLRFLPRPQAEPEPVGHPYRYSLLTLSCLVLLALLLSVDLLAAKRYLDPHTAGLYAAVSLSGKVVFFATSALTLCLFPIFSERQEKGIDAKGTLAAAVAVVIGGSALLIAVYFVAPQLVVAPLFGSHYAAAGEYIGWMGVAFGAYAVVYLTAMYLLAQQNSVVSAVLAVAVLVQVAGLYTFHSTISSIIAVDFVVLLSTSCVLSTLALQGRAVSSPAPEPA
jgi:O-antigen/teichoic acid export membrane protein